MEGIFKIQASDLVLNVKNVFDPTKLNLGEWDDFLDVLCGERDYQKEAIKTAIIYLASSEYLSIEQLAKEYEGQIKICKVNVDEEQDLASRHGIVSIPMLVVYQHGNIVNQKAGAMPKPEIEKLFRDLL